MRAFFQKKFFFLGIFVLISYITLYQVGLPIYSSMSVPLNDGNTELDLFKELEEKYIKIVAREHPRAAIRLLSIESENNPHVSALCHDLLHSIGRAAHIKYGSFHEAVRFQDSYCNSGYIHGLFESYLKTNQDSFSELSSLCADNSGPRAFDSWQCHHGIGHGFMYYTGGELDTALSYCNTHLVEPSAVKSCQNGVYMEVFNQEILNREWSFVDPANPFSTCAKRDAGTDECYMYVPTYLSQTKHMGFAEMFSQCVRMGGVYQHACISGIGSEAMKRNMKSPERVFDLCSNAGSLTHQSSCVFGMVSMYLNQKGTDDSGPAFCGRAPLQYRMLCRSIVESQKDFFE